MCSNIKMVIALFKPLKPGSTSRYLSESPVSCVIAAVDATYTLLEVIEA